MSEEFARAFQEATVGIRQCDLAQAMADATPGEKRDARNWVANLSRIQNGKQIPRTATIRDIADAIGQLTSHSPAELAQLKSQLIEAAATADRARLRSDCMEALNKNPDLDEHAIQNMLNHMGIAVMKKIIKADKKGQEIGEELLIEVTTDLEQTTTQLLGRTEISAGRARILIEGEVTPEQRRVLENAAGMIQSVLEL